eukprot:TRINITY_DN10258_c0_g1_i4.p1 TRINITY_DN10258_c0_g1~~TRINITY_DN10258_c0_g1_i4.p1  ORF type:complete len:291 (-),score=90.69 TRINITY_DN10258_c0_g1_i4:240-1112(-)
MNTDNLRESHILMKSTNFNEELVKFKFHFKISFGVNEYESNLSKIKELDVEPNNNVLVLAHEFGTEEAAQNAAVKINDIYENVLPQLGAIPQVWEMPKTKGKTLIACFRIPEEYGQHIAMIEPMISTLGEITSSDQHFEIEFATYSPTKEIFLESDNYTASDFVIGSFFKLSIVTHKDLPSKAAVLLSGMGVEEDTVKVTNAVLSSLKHVRFEIEIEEGIPQKEALKNQILKGVQMIHTTLSPLGLLDVVKSMEEKVTATMCISPVISLDVSLFTPTLAETLNLVQPPNP